MIRRLAIEERFGVFHVLTDRGGYSAITLEKALAKASPNAPGDYILHAAEVLEPLLSSPHSGQIHEGIVTT